MRRLFAKINFANNKKRRKFRRYKTETEEISTDVFEFDPDDRFAPDADDDNLWIGPVFYSPELSREAETHLIDLPIFYEDLEEKGKKEEDKIPSKGKGKREKEQEKEGGIHMSKPRVTHRPSGGTFTFSEDSEGNVDEGFEEAAFKQVEFREGRRDIKGSTITRQKTLELDDGIKNYSEEIELYKKQRPMDAPGNQDSSARDGWNYSKLPTETPRREQTSSESDALYYGINPDGRRQSGPRLDEEVDSVGLLEIYDSMRENKRSPPFSPSTVVRSSAADARYKHSSRQQPNATRQQHGGRRPRTSGSSEDESVMHRVTESLRAEREPRKSSAQTESHLRCPTVSAPSNTRPRLTSGESATLETQGWTQGDSMRYESRPRASSSQHPHRDARDFRSPVGSKGSTRASGTVPIPPGSSVYSTSQQQQSFHREDAYAPTTGVVQDNINRQNASYYQDTDLPPSASHSRAHDTHQSASHHGPSQRLPSRHSSREIRRDAEHPHASRGSSRRDGGQNRSHEDAHDDDDDVERDHIAVSTGIIEEEDEYSDAEQKWRHGAGMHLGKHLPHPDADEASGIFRGPSVFTPLSNSHTESMNRSSSSPITSTRRSSTSPSRRANEEIRREVSSTSRRSASRPPNVPQLSLRGASRTSGAISSIKGFTTGALSSQQSRAGNVRSWEASPPQREWADAGGVAEFDKWHGQQPAADSYLSPSTYKSASHRTVPLSSHQMSNVPSHTGVVREYAHSRRSLSPRRASPVPVDPRSLLGTHSQSRTTLSSQSPSPIRPRDPGPHRPSFPSSLDGTMGRLHTLSTTPPSAVGGSRPGDGQEPPCLLVDRGKQPPQTIYASPRLYAQSRYREASPLMVPTRPTEGRSKDMTGGGMAAPQTPTPTPAYGIRPQISNNQVYYPSPFAHQPTSVPPSSQRHASWYYNTVTGSPYGTKRAPPKQGGSLTPPMAGYDPKMQGSSFIQNVAQERRMHSPLCYATDLRPQSQKGFVVPKPHEVYYCTSSPHMHCAHFPYSAAHEMMYTMPEAEARKARKSSKNKKKGKSEEKDIEADTCAKKSKGKKQSKKAKHGMRQTQGTQTPTWASPRTRSANQQLAFEKWISEDVIASRLQHHARRLGDVADEIHEEYDGYTPSSSSTAPSPTSTSRSMSETEDEEENGVTLHRRPHDFESGGNTHSDRDSGARKKIARAENQKKCPPQQSTGRSRAPVSSPRRETDQRETYDKAVRSTKVSKKSKYITGNAELLQLSKLLNGRSDINEIGAHGYTLLDSAVEEDDVRLVALLLAAGADASIISADGMTAIDRSGPKSAKLLALGSRHWGRLEELLDEIQLHHAQIAAQACMLNDDPKPSGMRARIKGINKLEEELLGDERERYRGSERQTRLESLQSQSDVFFRGLEQPTRMSTWVRAKLSPRSMEEQPLGSAPPPQPATAGSRPQSGVGKITYFSRPGGSQSIPKEGKVNGQWQNGDEDRVLPLKSIYERDDDEGEKLYRASSLRMRMRDDTEIRLKPPKPLRRTKEEEDEVQDGAGRRDRPRSILSHNDDDDKVIDEKSLRRTTTRDREEEEFSSSYGPSSSLPRMDSAIWQKYLRRTTRRSDGPNLHHLGSNEMSGRSYQPSLPNARDEDERLLRSSSLRSKGKRVRIPSTVIPPNPRNNDRRVSSPPKEHRRRAVSFRDLDLEQQLRLEQRLRLEEEQQRLERAWELAKERATGSQLERWVHEEEEEKRLYVRQNTQSSFPDIDQMRARNAKKRQKRQLELELLLLRQQQGRGTRTSNNEWKEDGEGGDKDKDKQLGRNNNSDLLRLLQALRREIGEELELEREQQRRVSFNQTASSTSLASRGLARSTEFRPSASSVDPSTHFRGSLVVPNSVMSAPSHESSRVRAAPSQHSKAPPLEGQRSVEAIRDPNGGLTTVAGGHPSRNEHHLNTDLSSTGATPIDQKEDDKNPLPSAGSASASANPNKLTLKPAAPTTIPKTGFLQPSGSPQTMPMARTSEHLSTSNSTYYSTETLLDPKGSLPPTFSTSSSSRTLSRSGYAPPPRPNKHDGQQQPHLLNPHANALVPHPSVKASSTTWKSATFGAEGRLNSNTNTSSWNWGTDTHDHDEV